MGWQEDTNSLAEEASEEKREIGFFRCIFFSLACNLLWRQGDSQKSAKKEEYSSRIPCFSVTLHGWAAMALREWVKPSLSCTARI
jgi:hypothetical protein